MKLLITHRLAALGESTLISITADHREMRGASGARRCFAPARSRPCLVCLSFPFALLSVSLLSKACWTEFGKTHAALLMRVGDSVGDKPETPQKVRGNRFCVDVENVKYSQSCRHYVCVCVYVCVLSSDPVELCAVFITLR